MPDPQIVAGPAFLPEQQVPLERDELNITLISFFQPAQPAADDVDLQDLEDFDADQASPVTPDPVTDVTLDNPGPAPPLIPEMLGDTFYTVGGQQGRYDGHSGLIQQPICGPGGTQTEILRVHGGYATRVIEWAVSRIGAPPQAPGTDTNNPNEVLAHWTLYPVTSRMTATGLEIFSLHGRYVYFLQKAPAPPGGGDRFSTGVPVYNTNAAASYDILPGQFEKRELDSSSAVPAGFVSPGPVP